MPSFNFRCPQVYKSSNLPINRLNLNFMSRKVQLCWRVIIHAKLHLFDALLLTPIFQHSVWKFITANKLTADKLRLNHSVNNHDSRRFLRCYRPTDVAGGSKSVITVHYTHYIRIIHCYNLHILRVVNNTFIKYCQYQYSVKKLLTIATPILFL